MNVKVKKKKKMLIYLYLPCYKQLFKKYSLFINVLKKSLHYHNYFLEYTKFTTVYNPRVSFSGSFIMTILKLYKIKELFSQFVQYNFQSD